MIVSLLQAYDSRLIQLYYEYRSERFWSMIRCSCSVLLAVSAAASTAPASTMKIVRNKRSPVSLAELKSYWWLEKHWLDGLDDAAVAQLCKQASAAAA